MTYRVHLVADAELDLFEIYQYIALSDFPDRAEKLLAELEQVCLSLADLPERGHLPPELEQIDVRHYREIHCKMYRIIYEIRDSEVFIHCILDGRRDLQELLQHRLFRA